MKMKLKELFWYLLPLPSLLMMFGTCDSYVITVDAYDEACFFDRVNAGTRIGVNFEVIDGGFLDIDLRITGPDDNEIVLRERESGGKVVFAANTDGKYNYCFSNKMSTMTRKDVMFSVNIGNVENSTFDFGNYTREETLAIEPEKFEAMIKDLKASILAVKWEQDYMEVRDRIHVKINDSTNFRVNLWAFFESLMVIAMSITQVLYIKQFFEVRRIV